jgi:hypothetical protein
VNVFNRQSSILLFLTKTTGILFETLPDEPAGDRELSELESADCPIVEIESVNSGRGGSAKIDRLILPAVDTALAADIGSTVVEGASIANPMHE